MVSLYKYKVKESRNELGFFNAAVLGESYIIGANRNYYLNFVSILLFGFVIAGLLFHGVLRFLKNNMAEKLYFYPVWVRSWHWSNALMFLFLILTGLSMQYSNPDNRLIRFDIAVTIHNIAGVVVTVAYFIFVFGNLLTSNGKFYKSSLKGSLSRLRKQINFYAFGIFRNETVPFPLSETRKFNPLQKVSYLFAMYSFLPLLIITGFGFLFPEIIFSRILGFSGIHLTDLIHIISGFILSVFMIIHIYFCTIGITTASNFISMFSGWH
jgi:thiosulfate reductase cytochrome b subunit